MDERMCREPLDRRRNRQSGKERGVSAALWGHFGGGGGHWGVVSGDLGATGGHALANGGIDMALSIPQSGLAVALPAPLSGFRC